MSTLKREKPIPVGNGNLRSVSSSHFRDAINPGLQIININRRICLKKIRVFAGFREKLNRFII